MEDEKGKYSGTGIFIAWHLCGSGAQLDQTMIHEMVHVEELVEARKSGSKLESISEKKAHGPKFWRRMSQLMSAGAFKGIL